MILYRSGLMQNLNVPQFITQILLLISFSCAVISAQPADSSNCDNILQQAQQAYYNAEFDRAIELVKTCIQKTDLTTSQKEQAYRVLALTSLSKGDTSTSEKFIRKILELNPKYAPTIATDRPDFVELVNSMRKTMPVQKARVTSRSKLLWYGAGGAILVSAAVYMLTKGGSNKKQDAQLPPPPDWPK